MNATTLPTFSLSQAREGIEKAKTYLEELFPEHRPFAFEEVRLAEMPSPRWSFTFSYKVPDFPFPRYKAVEVSLDDYSLLQVTNR